MIGGADAAPHHSFQFQSQDRRKDFTLVPSLNIKLSNKTPATLRHPHPKLQPPNQSLSVLQALSNARSDRCWLGTNTPTF